MHPVNVLVVIPTYNEALNITGMLESIRGHVPSASILVVDDGSPDGTADIVEKQAELLGSINLLRRTQKDGLGSAYRAGFAWGLERGFDAFVEIDADFQHDPSALPSLLEAAEGGAGVVIGSRYVSGGETPKWPWYRLFLSRGGNQYASILLGLKVADSTAGFRVYRADALRTIDFASVQADGYGFQIEMTYRARRAKQVITEVPISFTDREVGESKMSSTIIVEALFLVTKWAIEDLLGKGWKPKASDGYSATSAIE
jgi:dolichol-phosphate mannosyltransferase